MKNRIAMVNNLKMLAAAVDALCTSDPGMPVMAIASGGAGSGKTQAVAWAAVKHNAVYVRAIATDTPTSLCSSIMRELGSAPFRTAAPMINFIAKTMSELNRPLFIDEADYVVENPRLCDSMRDLHDISSMPVLMIGMASFRQRVAHREQLASRVSQWIEFRPADLKDARTLADMCCEVRVSDDLLAALHRSSGGSMRRLSVGLSRIERFARKHNLSKVSLPEWSGGSFTFSEPSRGSRTMDLENAL
ncbi:MAG: AAA family ATPase [Candidatus Binatus sp.]|uniref:AAA family ATPase n=1 Tax=Candidatus Binatus sp. TaxID=2811406 RepID=UPI002727DE7C|nr:AAA family ATPase [Candidatus Binatus sp.]MDO8431767.1 AAA family ATPase [Candidatus Binatus sp.]